MGNGINKVFVNLGVAMIILGLVAAGMQMRGVNLLNAVNNTMDQPAMSTATVEGEGKSTPHKATHVASQAEPKLDSSPSSEGRWVKAGTKVCEIAWNNKDFKDGWCKVGDVVAGEYRFKVRSSLKMTSDDGIDKILPETGVSIQQWRNSTAQNREFAEYFDTWTILKNGQIGQVIFKTSDGSIFESRDISLNGKDSVYTSFNFAMAENAWERMGFRGKITIEVFKKKS
jgi:hypothetical protein